MYNKIVEAAVALLCTYSISQYSRLGKCAVFLLLLGFNAIWQTKLKAQFLTTTIL